MVVVIYADFTAFFLVNDAVGIDLGDRFCPSFDGAVKKSRIIYIELCSFVLVDKFRNEYYKYHIKVLRIK